MVCMFVESERIQFYFFFQCEWFRMIMYFLPQCPQSCTANPVEGLLEVNEDIVEVLLVLEIFLAENA